MSKHYERQANQNPVKYVTFYDSKKTCISAIAVYLFILLLSRSFSKFVYNYGISMCKQLFILSCFLWVLIISWKHAVLSVLPKEFSLLYIGRRKDRGSVRELFDLSLCDHFTAIHLKAEKWCPCTCTSSLLPFVPFVLWFYPLLGMGTQSIQVVFIKYLNFHILNDKVTGQALALFSSPLDSDLLTHMDWVRAVFTLLFTQYFLWTQRNPAALITEGSKKVITGN